MRWTPRWPARSFAEQRHACLLAAVPELIAAIAADAYAAGAAPAAGAALASVPGAADGLHVTDNTG